LDEWVRAATAAATMRAPRRLANCTALAPGKKQAPRGGVSRSLRSAGLFAPWPAAHGTPALRHGRRMKQKATHNTAHVASPGRKANPIQG